MARSFLAVFAAAALAAAAGCVYVPPVTQGNYLQHQKLLQLKVGMTPTQVEYLFGEPMLADPFYPNTWHYVYYYKRGQGSKSYIYRLTVNFKNGKVASFDTSEPISTAPGAAADREKTPAPPSASAVPKARQQSVKPNPSLPNAGGHPQTGNGSG